MGLRPNNDKDNDDTDERKCGNCGSKRFKVDDRRGEVSCEDCGVVDERIQLAQDGVEITRVDQTQNTPTRQLGSKRVSGKGKEARRLKRTEAKATRNRPSFLDETLRVVDEAVDGERTKAEAKELLKGFDEEEASLAKKRRKLRGTRGMSKADARAYKQRLYAAASLKALNDEGRSNQAPQLAKRWGLRHSDLIWASAMLNRFLSRNRPDEDSASRTRRLLLFNLRRSRDILAERVGWEAANEAFDGAVEELKSHGEPMDSESESTADGMVGDYCNMAYHVAAWKAMVISMVSMGIGDEMIRWLRQRVPLTSTQQFTQSHSRAVAMPEEEE